jgi:UDP-2-acetamido-3-amino-2,3-dideoxy-glucuronate N-acetyltransferase
VNPDGSFKSDADWEVGPIRVRSGASLGASSVIVPGPSVVGLVGSGSVVTRDLADYELVVGNPARRVGSACPCGQPLRDAEDGTPFHGPCPRCGTHFPPRAGEDGA